MHSQYKTITPCLVTTSPSKNSLSTFPINPSLNNGMLEWEPLDFFHCRDVPSLLQYLWSSSRPSLKDPRHYCIDLDGALQVGSDKNKAEAENQLPQSGGHAAFDETLIQLFL